MLVINELMCFQKFYKTKEVNSFDTWILRFIIWLGISMCYDVPTDLNYF